MNVYAMKDKNTNCFGLVTLCNSDSQAIKFFDETYCNLIPQIDENDEQLVNAMKNFNFDLMCLGSIDLVSGEMKNDLKYVSSFNFDSIMCSYNMRGEQDVSKSIL